MTPAEHDDLDGLAGEYVLGTLGADARRDVERRLPHEPVLMAAVADWEARLEPLTGAVEPLPLPDALWQRVAASLSAAETNTPPAQGGWWRNLALWRGLTLTGFATAAILAAVLVRQHGLPQPGPQYLVVLVAPQDKAPGWVIQADARKALSLVPLGVAALPDGKALQFWTKADGWSAPLSLGLVRPGQRVDIAPGQLPPVQPNQLFELTLEPPGGSPTGKPTGPIQFIGRAVPVT